MGPRVRGDDAQCVRLRLPPSLIKLLLTGSADRFATSDDALRTGLVHGCAIARPAIGSKGIQGSRKSECRPTAEHIGVG